MWRLHSSQAAGELQYENVPSAPAMSFEDSYASWSSTGSVSSPSEATAPPSVVDADFHSPTTPAKRSPPWLPSRPQSQRQEHDMTDGGGLEISDDPAEVCVGSKGLRPTSDTARGNCGDNDVEQSPEVAIVCQASGKLTGGGSAGRKVRGLLSSRRTREAEGSEFVDMSREDLITRAMEVISHVVFWVRQTKGALRALLACARAKDWSPDSSVCLFPSRKDRLLPQESVYLWQKFAMPLYSTLFPKLSEYRRSVTGKSVLGLYSIYTPCPRGVFHEGRALEYPKPRATKMLQMPQTSDCAPIGVRVDVDSTHRNPQVLRSPLWGCIPRHPLFPPLCPWSWFFLEAKGGEDGAILGVSMR